MHRRERSSMREGSCPQRRRTPSFSSTLLDTICRSIDQSKTDLDEDQQLGLYNETKHINVFSYNNRSTVPSDKKGGKERMNLRQAVMIEDWMEKQQSSHTSSQLLNSSSSSSECSSGGVFSSSETDTSQNKQRSKPKSEKPQKKHVKNTDHRNSKQQQKAQREGGFARTKLRALKIYDELNQKVKQPISPGSRIASFLSSIFNSHNVKKAKMCYVGVVEDVTFEHKSKSPCFSSNASSISRRSCMSKTPSSAKGKSNNDGIKRSVKFYPVSMILGEDISDHPSSHNFVYESDPSLLPLSNNIRKVTRNSNSIEELKNNTVMAKDNGVEVAAHRFIKGKFDFGGFYDNGEEEDDAVSYSSSDLFELDHLIGGARFQEELPVYETTNLETNKVIANGLRL